mgnify:CR=1 FL=1
MISFFFKVNKSFLEYTNHPITIPRENNSQLIKEVYGGNGRRTIPVHITPPEGRNLAGEIYYGVSGYGGYYQIKALGDYPGYYLGDLQIGNVVFITINMAGNKTVVKIHSPEELRKVVDDLLKANRKN